MRFDPDKFRDDVLFCALFVDAMECPECGGQGEVMFMVCYGGPPLERYETCGMCSGECLIENLELPEYWWRPDEQKWMENYYESCDQ